MMFLPKIGAFVLGLCLIGGTNAWGGSCSPVPCDPDNADTSEMLTVDGYTGDTIDHPEEWWRGQYCYMCDTGGAAECAYNDIVAILNNRTTTLFYCNDDAGTDDSWESKNISDLNICGDSPLKDMVGNFDNAEPVEVRRGTQHAGATSSPITATSTGRQSDFCQYRKCRPGFKASNDGYSCLSTTPPVTPAPRGVCTNPWGGTMNVGSSLAQRKTLQECNEKGLNVSDNNGSMFAVTCESAPMPICKATACTKGTINISTGKCEGGKTAPVSGGKTCWELRAGWPQEALRCCDTGRDAKLTPATAQGKCICNDSSKEFKIVNGTGMCVDKNATVTPQPTANCDSMFINAEISCATNTTAVSLLAQVKAACKSDSIQPDAIIAQIIEISKMCITAEPEPVVVDNSGELRAAQSRISSVYKRLQAQVDGFGRSVWKNKEGNFNTSRLASDTIAAVVLGTAGGLITSNVIKKNQVSGGFEDIQCTIGGQSVAGWDDEFRVGMQ